MKLKQLPKEKQGRVDKLLDVIRALPGQKILTLAHADGRTFVIDVSPEGDFGYEPGHLALLVAKVINMLFDGGAITIRQFREDKVEIGDREFPRKNIYSIVFVDGDWKPVPPEGVQWCQEHDFNGEPIEPEPGLVYPALEV